MDADIATPDDISLTRPVIQLIRQAVIDFQLIEPGDRIAVGMSGGKDSLMLAAAMRELSRHGDLDFAFEPIHLDQNQPGFDRETFQRALDRLELDCTVIDRDTHSVVQAKLEPGQIPCSLCSRMRRGILNDFCREQGFNKLALGHHLDDAVETFFLNLFFGRRLDPLKPSTPTDEGDVDTIRPMILLEERKVTGWIAQHAIPTVDCPVCDTYPESRRRDLKHMLTEFSQLHGDLHASVRTALYEDGRTRTLLEPFDVPG